MVNFVAALVLIAIIGLAAGYIIRAKKSGQKCIGCPDSRTCSGNCSGCKGCSKH